MNEELNRRVLIIDDNPAIHEDYRKILAMTDQEDTHLINAEELLFGGNQEELARIHFEVDSAYQGEEGLAKVQQSLTEGRPYAMAFVDMRMPPGWDGLKTIQRIWEIEPRLEIVICSAYSDHSWANISKTLNGSNQLLILKKPFDNIEVLQMASALTEKWALGRLARLRVERVEEMAQERSLEVLLANETVKDFMSNISHELLTPLNGIVGVSEALQTTPLNEDQKELLELLSTASDGLTKLLRNIIDCNQIECGKFALENNLFDIHEICHEALETVAAPALDKHLQMRHSIAEDVPENLFGDGPRLRQVLVELVGNGVKFTQTGHVSLEVGIESENSSDVTLAFSIKDTGIGFSTETIKRLGMDFSQADGSTTRKFGGIGLGLTLGRQIVGKMDGTLQIGDQDGHGAEVNFTARFHKINAAHGDPSESNQENHPSAQSIPY